NRAAVAGRTYRQLEPAAKLAEEWRRAVDDEAGARELLEEAEDPEAREMLATARTEIERLEEEIRLAMVRRDPNDDKNVILEIRERAMRVLRARLYEQALAEQQAELAADRRTQVGTGERAEKIRTYNYGERRVTDHRIKLTAHNLDDVLEGVLDEFTTALQSDEKRRALELQATA